MAAEISKPDFSYQWSSGGSIVAPSNVKIQTGWTAEVPPFQWENYLQNRQDNAILHLFQKGISEWDAASNYYFTASGVRSYVQGSDGIVYVAVQDSIGQNPTTDVSDTYWKVAFADNSTALTTTTGDARYTQRVNNLSDVSSISTARSNLSVYSKSETESLFPLGYFYGFNITNNSGAPNTTIDVGAGQAKTTDNLNTISILTTISGILQSSGTWSAGTGQNKLDTGAKANSTWYHIFAIRRTSDGAGDIIFSLSPTTPTLPSGYSGIRWLYAIYTNVSGNIKQFVNEGDLTFWKDVNNDINSSGVPAGTSTLPIAVPTGRKVLAFVDALIRGENSVIHVRSPDTNSVTLGPTATGGYVCGIGSNNDGSTAESVAATTEVLTNTSGQVVVQTYTSTGNIGFAVSTRGFKVFR